MREYEPNIPESRKRARKEQASDRPSCIVGHLGEYSGNVWYEIPAAIRRGWMKVNGGLTAIEFVEHWRVDRIARPSITVTCKEHNSICIEHIQSVRDLPQAAFGIRERNGGKETEAARVVPNELRRGFVPLARLCKSEVGKFAAGLRAVVNYAWS
jgi:hypothetical protein